MQILSSLDKTRSFRSKKKLFYEKAFEFKSQPFVSKLDSLYMDCLILSGLDHFQFQQLCVTFLNNNSNA